MQEAETSLSRNIAGAAAGNVIEWYDFAIYAYLAPVLAKLFFPSDDPLESLIATFGAFAAGYIAGPIGALFFGHVGDKIGRKPMLMISILMMGLATTAIGAMPVAQDIGWFAGAGLVALRLLQGLSSSGEYGGSLAFVSEHAPPNRRGFAASFILIGSNIGFLIGAGVAAAVTFAFGDKAVEDWAWRLPFLFGGLVALLGLLLRSRLQEPPVPPDYKPVAGTPVIAAFRYHWRQMLQVGGLVLTVNAGFYLIYVYALSYLTTVLRMPETIAMDINTLCIVLMCVLPLGSAILSDRIGRKPVLLIGNLAVLALSYPLFMLIDTGSFTPVLLGQIGFAMVFSWIYGANSVAQVEVVPRQVRATVMIIPANIVAAAFTGTMPLVAAYLVQRTGDDMVPVLYLMGFAVLTLAAVLTIREMAGKPLD